MKDPTYRAKCIDKVLSKHSTLEVISGLTDIALDIFQLSLKNENKTMSKKEIQRKIKELNKWKNQKQRREHEKTREKGKRKITIRKTAKAHQRRRNALIKLQTLRASERQLILRNL